MIDIKKYTKGKCTVRWLIAVLCVLAVSCVRDGEDPMPDGPSAGNSVRVEILHRAPESGSISRALTAGDETRIDNVLVLFFRKNGMTLHSVAEGSKLTAKSDDDKTYTFETSFSVESALASEPFTCIVLANAADRYNADERRSWRLQTYNDLQAKLTQQVTDKLHTSNTGGFVMWGKANEDLIPSTPQQKLSVPLLRSVARVDVAVDAQVTNFTLTEVQIYKPNNRLSVMPKLDSYDVSGRKVTAPSVPVGTAILAQNWKYDVVAGNQIDYSIYIPESDVILNGDGTPGDANHLNRCAIVVGGKYPDGNAPTTYYRIDFKEGTPASGGTPSGKLMDVLRNHRYNVRITQVMGRGEETPDKAYESRTADVTAEIITWTDNNQNIAFDGTNWASVERKEVHLNDGQGVEALLQLLSNVKPSQWSMQFSLPNGTATSAEVTDASVSGSHFEVTKPADRPDAATEQGGKLTIRTKEALPAGSQKRHEVLTIRIGRLEVVVNLYQHPYSDTEWENGGDVENDF
mgnify:FL=1